MITIFEFGKVKSIKITHHTRRKLKPTIVITGICN